MTPPTSSLLARAQVGPRLRSWRHMAESAVRSNLTPDWVPAPRVAYLLVTMRCNSHCLTCNAWKVESHDDLPASGWRSLFRQAPGLDIIKILGGEPFSRPDILEILSDARELCDPYILQVTTNGWDTDTILDAVRRVGWPGLQIRVSVDGTEATHDRMRGTAGLWAAANRTLQGLADLRPTLGFHLGINFAIKDESLHELDAMMAYAERHGADLIPGVNVSPFLDGTVPPEERPQRFVGLTDLHQALPILEHRRAGIRRQLPAVDHWLTRPITGQVFRRQIEERRLDFRCRAAREILYVEPDGAVVRCSLDTRPMGNLRDRCLEDIWHGEEARIIRERVDRCTGCLQASIHILSRFYTGRVLPWL